MHQLYLFTGTLRSMTIEKARFKRLGPFWKEQKPLFLERREYDSTGRLVQRRTENANYLYSFLAEEEADPRPAAIYRFDGDDALKGREIFYYNEEGYCTGREFYEKGELNRTIQQEEDPDRGVVIEREDGRIRGKQYDRRGNLLSEYLYGSEEADLIRKYTYSDRGHPLKREETNKNGRPVKTTSYECNEAGLITEIRETDREGELLYHRIFRYPRGEDRNWLVREEYALTGKNRKIPLSLIFRSLNFYQEPRLEENSPPPPSPRQESERTAQPEEEDEVRTVVFSNGYYRGRTQKDIITGEGLFSFNDGSRYQGGFEGGKPHGRGMMMKPDGSRYEGEFREGRMHGKGRLEWPDGSLYEGAFREGLMDGIGTFTWPNGDRFKGLFEKGRRTDQGLIERRD